MNNLKIFKNENFGEVRTLVIDNEPYFVASDICKCLELSNPTMAVNRLDEDERSKFNLGRQGETNVVNEYGLYNLILASRKKEAKKFKRWVTHEVLPAIRKNNKKQITLRIDDSLYKALENISCEVGINFTNLVLVALWKKILNI